MWRRWCENAIFRKNKSEVKSQNEEVRTLLFPRLLQQGQVRESAAGRELRENAIGRGTTTAGAKPDRATYAAPRTSSGQAPKGRSSTVVRTFFGFCQQTAQECGENSSSAPLGLALFSLAPTACAVGCILTPLRGCKPPNSYSTAPKRLEFSPTVEAAPFQNFGPCQRGRAPPPHGRPVIRKR